LGSTEPAKFRRDLLALVSSDITSNVMSMTIACAIFGYRFNAKFIE